MGLGVRREERGHMTPSRSLSAADVAAIRDAHRAAVTSRAEACSGCGATWVDGGPVRWIRWHAAGCSAAIR